MTTGNKPFLRYDNKKSNKRIVIFASDEGLSILASSTEWFCDGTSKSSPPKIANQIFPIHALHKDHVFPCVYVWT